MKSLAVRIKLFGENNDDVAKSYHNIGVTYSTFCDHK
jgi:hypothetical protein